jgi:serine/threonine-protein kinase PknK
VSDTELPARYEPLTRLGQGGGGEVWAVRDRCSRREFALKLLAPDAGSRELAALVREAVALSGLEGLGVPRVLRFGRLPGSERPFMLRELVEGKSLDALLVAGAPLETLLTSLARAADQLTLLHRAGLLHGDVKPANIIVESSGAVTFVDLGLAAPWREGGTHAEGLTPRYAAPELLDGKPLTVRAEVYALGVALSEALDATDAARAAPVVSRELSAVVQRATARNPDDRHPSVDEFASALRRAAGLPPPAPHELGDAALWPIVGMDLTAHQFSEAVQALADGSVLRVLGPPLSGRSALLRRLAWSLGAQGHPLAFIDDAGARLTLESELEVHPNPRGVAVLVDDADALDKESVELLEKTRSGGARLVLVGGERWAEDAATFVMPPLDERAATELVRRAIPSLTENLLKRVVEVSGGRPGELRRLVRLIATDAVASAQDIERKLGASQDTASVPSELLARATYYLDRGRFNDAKAVLEQLRDDQRVGATIARARLDLGLGDPADALALLSSVTERLPSASGEERVQHALYLSRALVGTGDYALALSTAEPVAETDTRAGAEARAYQGLALSLLGRHADAEKRLEEAIALAEKIGSARVEGLALVSLGFVMQRADRNDRAQEAHERALVAAERASDAGTLGSAQLNLAGLLKIKGHIAGAIDLYEAAVDMGRRSGRRSTSLQALLNLANADLYLGRLARARASIDALDLQRGQLSAMMRAQLSGLEAELLARQGQSERAAASYDACAEAFQALGHGIDAAEARLEGILVAARSPTPDLMGLRKRLALAREALGETQAHRALSLLAGARVAELAGDESAARTGFDDAIKAAREAGQKEWIWRALEARADVEETGGQPLLARRDREEALAVLEDIGARLPRDLREVYWNDPRRRRLRTGVPGAVALAATEFSAWNEAGPIPSAASRSISQLATSGSTGHSQHATPLEQKLSRILEVNSELAGEHDLEKLTARVTDYAVELVRAERGSVLLCNLDGSLSVHTSRSRGAEEGHAEFSRSVATKVVESREAFVSVNARADSRLGRHASVHQMSLESVACVPILAPSGQAIGALYLETRARRGAHFERELPTLRAFADQVAIALENTRLISENRARADELAEANEELEAARERLEELLGDRTEQLRRTKKKLKAARETLYGHFGYHGLVGTSAAMRRVYALIDRLKDTDIPVLITGESGTGKEMVARAVHRASPRADAKILGVNCGAIPENLLESELFGHVRGAFTGADRERKGLFRECDGGTILLDEVGETPKKMQAGLLRVLQERKVRPVGGNSEEDVDVRVMFATNRDLGELVKNGAFREDLYYRIQVVEVRLPALRERAEDIPQLVDHFLGIFAARYKRDKKVVSRDALRRLSEYQWPGNVRQLENVLLNAWVMSEEPELLAEDFELPDGWVVKRSLAREGVREGAREEEPKRETQPQKRRGTVSEHRKDERERIIEALRSCNWNRVKAAELSGIPRRTFYRRLREYGIQ